MFILLIVNWVKCMVDVLVDKFLLWVLCEDFDLCGMKFGCGVGLCGVCMVIFDGDVV